MKNRPNVDLLSENDRLFLKMVLDGKTIKEIAEEAPKIIPRKLFYNGTESLKDPSQPYSVSWIRQKLICAGRKLYRLLND